MPKRLKLEPHQTASELSKLYRQASDPIERTRYQIILLLATGRVTEDVANVTGYCRNSIYRLVRRYNQLGAHGLKDKRHQHPGTQPLLSVVEQAQLLQTLQAPPGDGGLWNSRKVAEWISNLLDRPVSVQRVGTIYAPWSFGCGYPDLNMTSLTLRFKKLGKKTVLASQANSTSASISSSRSMGNG
jgi:transposase